MGDLKRAAKRHAVALVAAALAYPFALVLWSLDQRLLPLLLFLAAVGASAWLAGPRAAVITTLLLAAALFVTFVLFFADKSQRSVDFLLLLLGLIFLGLSIGYASREIRRARFAKDQVPDISSSAGEGLIATDAHGYVISINPLAQYLTGWPAADAIGQYLETVLNVVDGADHRPIHDLAGQVLQATSDAPVNFEGLLISYQRTQTKVEGAAVPFLGSNGHVKGLTVRFRDITHKAPDDEDLRRAEDRAANLERNLRQAQTHAAGLSDRLRIADDRGTALAAELEQTKLRLEEAVQRAEEQTRALNRQHAEAMQLLESQLQEAKEESVRQASEELTSYETNAEDVRQAHDRLEKDLEVLREANERLEKEVSGLRDADERLQPLEKDLEEARIRADLAEETLHASEAQLVELRTENEKDRAQSTNALAEARAQLQAGLESRDAAHAAERASLHAQLAESRANEADIHERYLRFEAVLEKLPAPVAIKDAIGTMIYANTQFRSMSGGGAAFLSNGSVDSPHALSDVEARVLQEGSNLEAEETFKSESGSRTYRVLKLSLRDSTGQTRGVASVYSQSRSEPVTPNGQNGHGLTNGGHLSFQREGGLEPMGTVQSRPDDATDWLSFN